MHSPQKMVLGNPPSPRANSSELRVVVVMAKSWVAENIFRVGPGPWPIKELEYLGEWQANIYYWGIDHWWGSNIYLHDCSWGRGGRQSSPPVFLNQLVFLFMLQLFCLSEHNGAMARVASILQHWWLVYYIMGG